MLGRAVERRRGWEGGGEGEEETFINLYWNNTSCHFSTYLLGSLYSRRLGEAGVGVPYLSTPGMGAAER